MMLFAKNKAIIALLCLLLCLGVLLAACENGQEDLPDGSESTSAEQSESVGTESESDAEDDVTGQGSDTDSESESETQPAIETLAYTVTVIGSDGNPRQGAMVVILKNGEAIVTSPTLADGTLTAELEVGEYEVKLLNLLGEAYRTEGCVLTPESTALTISLCGLPTAGEEIFAYSASADDYIAYDAKRVVEGRTMVTLSTDDMTYYLFVSSRGGTFKLSMDKDLPVSIGYFGSTSYVMTESVATEQDNAICVDVYDDMVFNYAFVIGIRAEDASLKECELTIEYVSERETTEHDLPWNDLMPDHELPKYTMGAGTVTNFAVDSAEIVLVYSESDGYYHVGSESGPVVLVNLNNNSKYMDALTTVCSNMRLGVYVYDEDGKLVSKDSYNELIWAYNEVADGGYYPLDDTLLDMLKTVGDYMGWYDPASPMYLFEGVALEPANAYLFACVYLQ